MRSIRARILTFLIPVTALALLLTAVGIERAVSRDLRAALDRQVLLMAQGMGGGLEVEVDGTLEFDLEEGDMPELEEAASESFYAVADEAGVVHFASGDPPRGLFQERGEEPFIVDADIEGETLRVGVISIVREAEGDEEDIEEWHEAHPGQRLPEIGPQRFWIAAGVSDEGLQDTLLLLRRRLLVGFGILGVLLVILPVAASGLSLAPLRRLSRQADGIGPHTPGARLDEEGVDREVRSLVEALNRALERIGQAYEEQKRFTANAAHELRSPLSAIRTRCEVSLRKERTGEELAEVVKSVHRTSLRLGEITESLLSLSRLEGSGAPVERKTVNLAETARETIHMLTPLAESRETEFHVELPESLPVTGDHGLLAECLSNILDNAIRYTPGGGSVTVTGGDGSRPWISVADTGIGIPEAHLGRIFERFYRVDSSRSRADGGSGLGLAIARAIARHHDAVLSVESVPGRGTRFTLQFTPQPTG